MKKIITMLLIGFAVFTMTGRFEVFAEGDKVRGENGAGFTTQICDTPYYVGEIFECPYGDYDPTL